MLAVTSDKAVGDEGVAFDEDVAGQHFFAVAGGHEQAVAVLGDQAVADGDVLAALDIDARRVFRIRGAVAGVVGEGRTGVCTAYFQSFDDHVLRLLAPAVGLVQRHGDHAARLRGLEERTHARACGRILAVDHGPTPLRIANAAHADRCSSSAFVGQQDLLAIRLGASMDPHAVPGAQAFPRYRADRRIGLAGTDFVHGALGGLRAVQRTRRDSPPIRHAANVDGQRAPPGSLAAREVSRSRIRSPGVDGRRSRPPLPAIDRNRPVLFPVPASASAHRSP